MMEIVSIPVRHCVCEDCGHDWHSLRARQRPATCPSCKSTTWNGTIRRGRPTKEQVSARIEKMLQLSQAVRAC